MEAPAEAQPPEGGTPNHFKPQLSFSSSLYPVLCCSSMRLMQSVAESGALTKPPLHVRDVLTYHLAEDFTAFFVYFMTVFSPWAFGTTEPWSIWTMRGCGYAVGLLLFVKWSIRFFKRYRPAKWEPAYKAKSHNAEPWMSGTVVRPQPPARCQKRTGWLTHFSLTQLLAVLTVCILLYCLIAALNARATFNPLSGAFDYHAYLRWLPHSLDRAGTWEAFWTYLALAFSFWGIRDWLLGKSATETRTPPAARSARGSGSVQLIPARLRSLVWVLTVSGGLLGFEGIVQRVSNSPKLLFMVKPEIHQTAETQLASYAYRANGGQYFNLLWPVVLGFWWGIRRSGHLKGIAKHSLLLCAGSMAVCPILSGARGGALVDGGMLMAAALVLLASIAWGETATRGRKARLMAALILYFAGVWSCGLVLGWHQLGPRLARLRVDLDEREQLYETACRIARDYPVFGTGPGTFERVFQLYRASPDAYWPAQLHNDWLETLVTFGWSGCALIVFAFVAVCLRWFAPGGADVGGQFVFFLWLSLAGCLVQARWDFPLQVYSILFLFVLWCAVLFTLSRRKSL